jgi:hypothetical protein
MILQGSLKGMRQVMFRAEVFRKSETRKANHDNRVLIVYFWKLAPTPRADLPPGRAHFLCSVIIAVQS